MTPRRVNAGANSLSFLKNLTGTYVNTLKYHSPTTSRAWSIGMFALLTKLPRARASIVTSAARAHSMSSEMTGHPPGTACNSSYLGVIWDLGRAGREGRLASPTGFEPVSQP